MNTNYVGFGVLNNSSCVVVANKIDLASERFVTYKDGLALVSSPRVVVFAILLTMVSRV